MGCHRARPPRERGRTQRSGRSVIEVTPLRPYQLEAIDAVRAEVGKGRRRVCLVLPTGAGKTRTAAEVVRRTVAAGKRVLWFAHRGELVDQAAATLAAQGVIVGAISASAATPPNPYAPVQVATVQTLLARNERPEAALLVADEAHHYVADQFAKVARDYPRAIILGLTATPQRGDGRGLDELFDGLVVGASIRSLTELGHLVRCEILRPPERLKSAELAQHPVDAFLAHAAARPTIVFARGVDLANEYAVDFVARGVSACAIHSETPWAERVRAIEAFRRGALRVLVNVYCLTEGFDVPETSCAIIARGCDAAGTYLQMIGRILRPAPGKTDALLIDLRGVSHDHGAPEDDRVFSLAGIELVEKEVCEHCGTSMPRGGTCPNCRKELPPVQTPQQDIVVGAQLLKFERLREDDDHARAQRLARWLTHAQARGYKPGWAHFKYRAVYGTRPPSAILDQAHAALWQAREAA